MADALGLRINQLFNPSATIDLEDTEEEEDKEEEEEEEAPYSKRMKTEPIDDLMKYLRDMMVGYNNEEVQALLNEVEDVVASEAYYRYKETLPSQVIQDDVLNTRRMERFDKVILICEKLCNIRYNSNVEEEKVVVGFDNEIETLLDQLTPTSAKKFQIISITGMAGLGKTTLARTLYNHELIKYAFDFRLWTTVSQVYLKKDMLLGILSSFSNVLTDDLYEMTEHQLGEKLYRKLKGRKFLVVFDDIWDCRVWDDLKMYFPDDKTGSRVIFTSRDIDVSLHVHSARPAHVLRLRTEVESRAIFLKKVFRMGICPYKLQRSGWVINRKCEGLPLAIVIAAGLTKNNLSVTWWEQISASLRSFMVSDPSQYIDSLAPSYNHMPSHLRPCFLFLGAFPEDYEIPVTKLTWLWIAQGLIHETGSRMLEDVADDFLRDLIKRSLIMTQRIKSDGQVRTCRIHDLLHDFVLRKAEEENFMSKYYRYGMLSSTLCFPLELGISIQEGGSIHTDTYKFLRTLDLESILISVFPLDVV